MLETAKVIKTLKGRSLGELLREYSEESTRREESPKPSDEHAKRADEHMEDASEQSAEK